MTLAAVPEIALPPFGVTVKLELASVWAVSRFSDHVTVTVLPSAATVAELIVGFVVSTVKLWIAEAAEDVL